MSHFKKYRMIGIVLLTLSLGAVFGLPQRLFAAPAPPQRILSINLCTDEILMGLVDKTRVVALTTLSGDKHVSTVYEQAQGIPKIKGNLEEVLKYAPDLVLAGVFSKRQTREGIKRLKIPMLTLDVAQSFEGIYTNIEKIAEAVGAEARGEAMIQKMKTKLAQIKPLNREKPILALFYQSAGNVPGRDTYQDSIFQAVGLENLAVRSGIVGHGHFPLERVVEGRPDLLIFWKDAGRENPSVGKEMLEHPAIRKGLPDLKTVTLPTHLLNCGAPSSVKAVELLHHRVSEAFR